MQGNGRRSAIGVTSTAENATFAAATATPTTVHAGGRKIFDVFGGLAITRRSFNLAGRYWSKTRRRPADTTMATQFTFPRIVVASTMRFFNPCSATSRRLWNQVMWMFERLSSALIRLGRTRVSVSVGGQLKHKLNYHIVDAMGRHGAQF